MQCTFVISRFSFPFSVMANLLLSALVVVPPETLQLRYSRPSQVHISPSLLLFFFFSQLPNGSLEEEEEEEEDEEEEEERSLLKSSSLVLLLLLLLPPFSRLNGFFFHCVRGREKMGKKKKNQRCRSFLLSPLEKMCNTFKMNEFLLYFLSYLPPARAADRGPSPRKRKKERKRGIRSEAE